jgi:hypothetical protein
MQRQTAQGKIIPGTGKNEHSWPTAVAGITYYSAYVTKPCLESQIAGYQIAFQSTLNILQYL